MFNYKMLRGKMAAEEVTQLKMAKYLGITPNTLRDKIRRGVFYSNEIVTIGEVLNLTAEELHAIFFAGYNASEAKKEGVPAWNK